ncbi:MAG: hypothetical protein ACRDE2_13240, partial [Chitinophagaceae bacterium]
MDTTRLQILLNKWASEVCTSEEIAELEAWYQAFDEQNIKDFLSDHLEKKEYLRTEILTALHERMVKGYQKQDKGIESSKAKKYRYLRLWRTV